MSTYTPDKWVILKLNNKGETAYKVLAGWSGGYLDGQSWKINSGITKVEEDDNYLLFHGYSGSVYKCHKRGYGTNMIMNGVLAQLEDVPDVQIMKEEEAMKELQGLKND